MEMSDYITVAQNFWLKGEQMKRIAGKAKRMISIMLAVAMVVTCVPQTGLSVLAAENEQMNGVDAAVKDLDKQNDSLQEGAGEAGSDEMSADIILPEDGTDDGGEAAGGVTVWAEGDDDSTDGGNSGTTGGGDDGSTNSTSYAVTKVVNEEQVTIEAAETVQENAAYSFTAAAKEGYEVKEVKVYQTLDYTANKDNPEELANHEIELGVTDTEGKTQYTIAENVIAWDITIVVTSDVKAVEPSVYQVTIEADTEQVTVDAAETVQENAAYTFTAAAQEGYEVKEVKVYKTEGYNANKDNQENPDALAEFVIATEAADTETEGVKQYTIAENVITEAITIVVTSDVKAVEPSVYQVTIEADTEQVTVDAAETVQENAAYTFTAAAQEGYEVKEVKVYKTEGYNANKDNQENPDALAEFVIATEAADTETEGVKQYTIAENVITEAITIVVTSDVKAVEPSVYQVTIEADTEQVTVDAAETVQENAAYTFTTAAQEGFEVESVKAYQTLDYTANKDNPEELANHEIELAVADVEGKTQYTIAENVIAWDITIVVTSQAAAEPEECTVMLEYPIRYIKGIMYAAGDSDKFQRYSSLGIKTYKGRKLRIKLSEVYPGYVAYAVKEQDTKEYIGPDGIYTIPSAEEGTIVLGVEERECKVTYEIIGAQCDEEFRISFSGTKSRPGEEPVIVEAGKGFSMTVRTGLPEGRRIGSVSYQIGDYVESFELNAKMRQLGGSFAVPKGRATDDVKFTIRLEDTPKHKVTFDYDSKRTRIDLSATGLILNEDGSVEVLDGSNAAQRFAFRPMMTQQGAKFKISEVTADGVVLNSSEETGQYYLRNISAPVTIKVVIALDEDKCNSLTLEAEGHKEAFTAVMTGFEEGDDDYTAEGGVELTAGAKTLTQADTLHAAVRVKEGYRLDRVELDGKALQAASQTDGQNVYDIPFDGKGNAKKVLKVCTSPIPTEAAKTVFLYYLKDGINAEAEETDKVVKAGDDSYELKQGATYFDFTVTVDGSEYEPLIQYRNIDGSSISAEFISRDGDKYRYSLAANRLPEDAVVTVSKETVYQTLKVSYDKSEVWIESARIGSGELEGTEERGGISYQVPRGKPVSVRANARENCQIVSAVTTIAGETKQETVSTSGFTLYVTADADSVTQIESQGSYNARPLQEAGGPELVPVNGVYNVSCYKGYRGGALRGTTEVYHDWVEVKINGRAVSDDDDSTGIDIQDESTAFYLGLTEAVAGKTIEVNLYEWDYDGDGEGKENRIASYKLKAGSALTKVAVEGIPASGLKNQPLNTVMSYKITPDPVTADLSVMKLAVEGDTSAVQAELTDGALRITTGETAGQKAQVKLYMDDDSESGERVLAQFTVTAVKQLEGRTPEVSLKLAGDVSLKLAVSAPAGTVKPMTGKLYYKVTATPKAGAGKPDKARADTQYVEKTDEAVQTVTLRVSDEMEGHGQPWDFDVAVELIQTREVLLEDGSNEEQAAIDRTTAYRNTFATRKAYYEDKLKLKKAKTTIYTGQEDVVVATAQFGKDTTFTEITARDITYPDESSDALQVDTDDDGRIIVSACVEEYYLSHNPKNGKHRIEVTAASTDSMYASRATMDVTVVRGIDFLGLDVPGTSIYKADKKAATVKVTPMFNWGDSQYIPKSKKLTWEITDVDGHVLTAGNPLYGMVTVKNGTVTVNKNYKVSAVKSDNQFKVKATAADYPGSRVTAYSETLTITGEAMTIGDIAIVRWTQEDNVEVIARNETPVREVEAEEIAGAYVAAFVTGAPVKDVYTWEEYDQYVIRNNISYKSGNAKALYVDTKDGYIEVHKPAKKVKLTAFAEDGSKAKKEMTITVNYDSAAKLGVEIFRYNVNERNWEEFSDPNEETPEFTDTSAARFRLKVKRWIVDGEQEEGHWDDITSGTNYKLDVNGAKIVNKDLNVIEIVANTGVVRITVTEKNTGVKTEYTLTNKGFTALAAPKVTIGSIMASGYGAIQETTGQFMDNSITDYSKYFAKVEVDWTAVNNKNRDNLRGLEEQIDPRGYFPLEADGSFRLRFCWPDSDYSYLEAGNYKLKVSLGEIDESGNFVPARKEAAAVLKIVKQKAASFKMTASYTISPKDNISVPLTGKGNYSEVYYKKLQNANIKGVENHFLDYFELADDRLQLRADWYDKNSGEPAATDLIGYVTYEAAVFAPNAPEEDGPHWAHSVKGTAKITVKWKPNNVAKYAVSNGNIYPDANALTMLTATANKKPVDIAYAMAAEDNQADWEIADVCASRITLKSLKEKNVNSKHAVTLLLVPAESYYAYRINASPENEREALIKRFGIAVKCNVTVKDQETKGKIKIDKKVLTQTFRKEQYDPEYGNYWLHIPYTRVFGDAEIEDIRTDVHSDLICAGWFSEEGADYIDFTVNKKALAEAVAADKLSYGGKVTIQAEISYKNCEVKDKFTFKLTLPEKAAYGSYEEAVAAIAKDKNVIAEKVTVGCWKGMSDEEWSNEQQNARWQLWDLLQETAGNDSDIDFDCGEDGGKIDEIMPILSAESPESQKDGKIVIQANLRNVPPTEEGRPRPEATVTPVTFTLAVKATGTEPADVRAAVESFVNSRLSGYATNEMSYDKLSSDLREYVKSYQDATIDVSAMDISNLRFDIWVQELDDSEDYGGWKHATPEEEGYISGYMHAYDIRYGADEITVPFKFIIARVKQ